MFNRDYQKLTEEIISFIKNFFTDADFNKVVIGLSGGVDSASACLLLEKALGRENILIALLPYGELNEKCYHDAHDFVRALNIPRQNVITINIKKVVDQIITHDQLVSQYRQGNIMARVRMIYLYDLAKKNKALVCGTENKTEYLLGYFTRYGDEASDFEPLRGLYKTEIRGLARYLGVPQAIIKKRPTAGLWPGQTDEDEFGFIYEDADKILYLKFDKKLSSDEIVKTSGIDKAIIDKILKRVNENKFKHNVPKINKM